MRIDSDGNIGIPREIPGDNRKLKVAKSINCEEIKRKDPEPKLPYDNPIKLPQKFEEETSRADEIPMSYELPKEIEDIKKMIRESYQLPIKEVKYEKVQEIKPREINDELILNYGKIKEVKKYDHGHHGEHLRHAHKEEFNDHHIKLNKPEYDIILPINKEKRSREEEIKEEKEEFVDGLKIVDGSEEFTGYGLRNYPNGDKYEGGWKEGKMEGYGKYNYANGDRYEGEYSNNLINGTGTFYYYNGNKYEGQWKNSTKHGKGKFKK